MRILIKTDGLKKGINIIIPNSLIFNSASALFVKKIINKHIPQWKLKYSDIRKISSLLRKMKKNHPGMALVDINTSDGTVIKIKP